MISGRGKAKGDRLLGARLTEMFGAIDPSTNLVPDR
jgi:hypothetical protein